MLPFLQEGRPDNKVQGKVAAVTDLGQSFTIYPLGRRALVSSLIPGVSRPGSGPTTVNTSGPNAAEPFPPLSAAERQKGCLPVLYRSFLLSVPTLTCFLAWLLPLLLSLGFPQQVLLLLQVGQRAFHPAGDNTEGGRHAEPLGMLVWMEAAAPDKADS